MQCFTRPMLRTVLALALGAGAAAAPAATLSVTVRDAAGKPAVDAVVSVIVPGQTPPPAVAAAAVVAQQGMRFVPYVSVVSVGTPVRFSNHDRYDHHVKSFSPAKRFALLLDGASAPDKPTESKEPVVFDQAGVVQLQCLFHGSMRGYVYVSDTPWVAKTGADGVATVSGVPEGNVELRVWHPDQWVDQTPAPLKISGPSSTAQFTLNVQTRASPSMRM